VSYGAKNTVVSTGYGVEQLKRCTFLELGVIAHAYIAYNRSVLTKPDHVREVFKDSDTHSKAINSDAGWLFGELLGQCVGLVSGAEWRRVRACLGSAWTYKSAVDYLPRIIDLTNDHFTQLHKSGGLKHQVLNPVADLRLLPFWIVADQIYGPLTAELKHELEQLIPIRESLFYRVVQGGLTRYSWSRYFPTQTNSDLAAFKKRWTRFNDSAHTACILANERAPIVEMFEQVRKGAMTSEHMMQTLDEMLFANLDVTIGGLSWNIVLLAMNPSIQDELRREITSSKLNGKAPDKNTYLLGSNTLLAASMLESARLKPLAPFTVPQAAPTSRVIDGYFIPANTNYVSNFLLRSIHHFYSAPKPPPSLFLCQVNRVPNICQILSKRIGHLYNFKAELLLILPVPSSLSRVALTLNLKFGRSLIRTLSTSKAPFGEKMQLNTALQGL